MAVLGLVCVCIGLVLVNERSEGREGRERGNEEARRAFRRQEVEMTARMDAFIDNHCTAGRLCLPVQ